MNPKKEMPEENVRLPLIASLGEALSALQDGALSLHDWIDLQNPDKGKETYSLELLEEVQSVPFGWSSFIQHHLAGKPRFF